MKWTSAPDCEKSCMREDCGETETVDFPRSMHNEITTHKFWDSNFSTHRLIRWSYSFVIQRVVLLVHSMDSWLGYCLWVTHIYDHWSYNNTWYFDGVYLTF